MPCYRFYVLLLSVGTATDDHCFLLSGACGFLQGIHKMLNTDQILPSCLLPFKYVGGVQALHHPQSQREAHQDRENGVGN
jgi:hypothetical protein